MGQALSIPEPGTRLPDERTPERVRRLLGRRVDFQRMDFGSRQHQAYRDLAQQLQASRLDLLTNLRQQVSASAVVASQVADAWRQAGGTPADVDTLAGGTAKLATDSQAAGKISDLNAINQKIQALVVALQAGLTQQRQDNATQATHAAEELPLATSDPTATHKRADDLRDDALATADAATHYNIGGTDRLTARITRDAAGADAATTPATLAGAIGWLRTDTDRLQSAMAPGMPDNTLYVSTAPQEMRSF